LRQKRFFPESRLLIQLRHAMLLVPGHENSSVLQTTAKQGVRANAVFPGGRLTPFHLRPANLQDRLAKISNEGARKCAARPTGGCAGSRLSDSMARLDEASYVNGSVLMVYGGQFTK
jgi:NAD(P)-dependent dehydrogenase (short-subunit alcohol dehydrogenase family)